MMRLDIKRRVDSTNGDITVNVGAGNNTVRVTAGLYDSLAALCAEVQTRLQAVDGSLTCSESSGVVTIAYTGTFTVTWDHPGLRDWLGWSGNLSGASTYSGSVSPGTFIATLPWDSPEPLGYSYTRAARLGPHQEGASIRLSTVPMWHVRAHVRGSEVSAFRTMASYLLRGFGARWWRNTGDASAWSATNMDGYVDVVMAGDRSEYADDWANPVTQTWLRIDLDFADINELR